ncbi:MAG: bifunctional phosphoribosylaminoimidazolecarboxamide formyltransferase/IMP cyclohydrolase [Bdellovibrionales bacterium]|nr:bifunctional phosphoribosylaminoimidazolecarboxamide formyltransferase/IMP cyclohydrolase [Bdellovibrionales bacterium]
MSQNSNFQFRNALVSVSDKTGLIDFIVPLAKSGMRVVSTGGTAKALREAGVPVIDVSDQTGFPEVMDGRVKTLHPKIHMGLLARAGHEGDLELLKDYGIDAFDLVVGNLYPFEEALKKNLSLNEQIEFIDIGGPSFLRSAAKSFDRMTVLCDPSDYSFVLKQGKTTLDDRKYLASKVFAHTSVYDGMISNYLSNNDSRREWSVPGKKVSDLRYGENPQQKAAWYRIPGVTNGLHLAEQIQGKELSYNNLLDLDAAVTTVREFPHTLACIAVKHNNPCGVARGKNPLEVVQAGIKADPVSVFGGIIAVNFKVDAASAQVLCDLFLECIIAPDFESEALVCFQKKKNVRILKWADLMKNIDERKVRTLSGGFVVQDEDHSSKWQESWRVIGQEIKSDEEKLSYEFAWKVCAHLKSNAIAICGSSQSVGLGMGQVNRVDAVEQAISRWKNFHPNTKDVVLASDAFFPFPDSIELAYRAGIKKIIQPGGSIKDEDVIEKAKELGIQMVLTGQRHFLH